MILRLARPLVLALAVVASACGPESAADQELPPAELDEPADDVPTELAPPDEATELVEEEREVPEIPEAWRKVGLTEELIAPWLSRDEAPATFRARLDTTEGEIVVECVRAWSPHGVDRFYNLVRIGFFRDVAFFRVLEGRIAQFGLHGNPIVTNAWKEATIADDPVLQSNRRGYLSFAKGPRVNSRSTQLFFNLSDNPELDQDGNAPIGRVVSGLAVLDRLDASEGGHVQQDRVERMGNLYLRQNYPTLDYIRSAELVE